MNDIRWLIRRLLGVMHSANISTVIAVAEDGGYRTEDIKREIRNMLDEKMLRLAADMRLLWNE